MGYLGLKIKRCHNINECVQGTDIVVTTTPSRKPIVKSDWITKGMHINAIGADAKGKEELDPLILRRARVFVDDWVQASHSGEINVAISRKIIRQADIKGTLGEVIIKKKRGRLNQDDITIFDSTGLAIQDVAVASFVYKEALKRGLGKSVALT
jgi:alanine dehydrogenase